jgi:DNA repair photolyase
MPVISASRRTDIPAFYSRWFVNRIRAGFCHWVNPFSNQVYRVSLAPEDCVAIVFWTRNPRPLMPHLAELDERGYKYYFLYTILGYPRSLEPHAPDVETAIQSFQTLSRALGPERVFWRYDPILFSDITPLQFHIDRFAYIAQHLAGYTQRCIYSFLVTYGKTKRSLAKVSNREGITFESPTTQLRHSLLTEMVKIAQSNEMQLYACCEDGDLCIDGIQRSSCVDLQVLRQLTSDPSLHLKPKPTRKFCGCVASVDIGSYDTCPYGCVYCYATNSEQAVVRRRTAHSPEDTILYRPEQLKGIDLDTLVRER